MNYDQYVEAMNDPRRRIGLWGPLGGAVAYRIDRERRPRAGGKPVQPATQVSPRQATCDDVVKFRLEQHRKAAEADRVIARLRKLR